jgi:hypothetical protein
MKFFDEVISDGLVLDEKRAGELRGDAVGVEDFEARNGRDAVEARREGLEGLGRFRGLLRFFLGLCCREAALGEAVCRL